MKDPSAAELLRGVVDHNARHSDAWLALARVHYDAKSWSDSERCYRKESKWVDAERCYRQVLARDPKNIQTHTDLATVLSLQNRPQESAEEFQIALDLLGSDRGALWEAAMLGYAMNESSHGSLDKAVERLEEILKQNPRAMAALHRLGTTHRRQRNWKAAESAFRSAVELIPKSANPHVGLGSTLLGQERYPEAEAEFRVALDLLEGQRTIVWEYSVVGRAVAVAAQGNPEQARKSLRHQLGRVADLRCTPNRHRIAARRVTGTDGRQNFSAVC